MTSPRVGKTKPSEGRKCRPEISPAKLSSYTELSRTVNYHQSHTSISHQKNISEARVSQWISPRRFNAENFCNAKPSQRRQAKNKEKSSAKLQSSNKRNLTTVASQKKLNKAKSTPNHLCSYSKDPYIPKHWVPLKDSEKWSAQLLSENEEEFKKLKSSFYKTMNNNRDQIIQV